MTTITSRTATPAKLRDGSWGARIELNSGDRIGENDVITIKARSGKSWTATVDRVLWSGPSNGRTAYLLAVDSHDAPKPKSRRPARRSCITGGNCSSFGSGRSCGGHDCDGW